MPEWIKELAVWLPVAASLVACGVTLGTLPRLSKELDDERNSRRRAVEALRLEWRRDKEKQWSQIHKNERALWGLRTEVAAKIGSLPEE